MKRSGLIAAAAVLALVACTPGGRNDDRVAPVALHYPYAAAEGAAFPGHQEIARGAAPWYVAVTIVADPASARETGRATVNAASGTIVHPGGYIVTAAHIALDDRYYAQVTTVDGHVHRGQVIDVSRDRELALIRIPPTPGLHAAYFADSSYLGRGQPMLAIGTPNGRAGAVSLGMVRDARLNYRLRYSGFSYPNALVIDMKVEPGHSGGPVINERGEFVGMIASFALGRTPRSPDDKTATSPAIAFAVPSNDVAAYLRDVTGLVPALIAARP